MKSIACFWLAMGQCGLIFAIDFSEEELAWLASQPKVTIAANPDRFPIEGIKAGHYQGMTVDVVTLISEKTGIQFEWIEAHSWQHAISMARTNQIDILSESDDSALKSEFLFTQSYMASPVAVVMNQGKEELTSFNQLRQSKIGIGEDYGYFANITTQYPQYQFQVYNKLDLAVQALAKSEIDALICTEPHCQFLIQQFHQSNPKYGAKLSVKGRTRYTTRMAFAISPNQRILLSIINKAIASISEQERNLILKNWQTNETIKSSNYTLVYQLITILILVLAFFTYRQYQLRKYTRKLKQSEARYARAVRGTQDGLWDWNLETNEAYLSPRWKSLLGFEDEELANHADSFYQRIHPDDKESVDQATQDHLSGKAPYDVEFRLLNKDGSYRWYRSVGQVEFSRKGIPKRMAGALSDITLKKQAADLEIARNRVLELIAKGEGFQLTLEAIIEIVEKENPALSASILLLKDNRLHFGAGPNLPDFYNQAIEEFEIGLERGSCGTAAYLKKRVIVEDIQVHPYWKGFKHLAEKAKFAACWSEPIFDSKGEVVGTFAIYHQHIGEPSEYEITLIENAATLAGIAIEKYLITERVKLASLVYQNSSEAMLIFGPDRSIMDVNPAFTEITGYTPEEVVGKQADILNSEFYEQHFYDAMSLAVNHIGTWQGEVKDRRKNGEIYYRWLTINTIYNEDKTIHRRVALFSDITERKKSEKIIWEQANYDSLTSLPNRNMFNDRLNQEIKKAKRDGLNFALLLLDLDQFKEVNDTLGHDYGDILLVEAAKRIKQSVREMDTVARLGGDEFTIILTELDEDSHIETVAQKIIDKMSQPFQLNEEVAYVSASIGITIYPEDSHSFESLLKNADQAMYEAKNLGRNRYQYFTHSMQEAAQNRMRLVADLRRAIELNQFELFYQPIVDITSGEICKAEALIRWHHPERGLVTPSVFISIAEETGIIVDIGEWVLQQAVTQIGEWRKTISSDFQISVNTSPAQYQAKDARQSRWLTHFKKTQTDGSAIVMEITEGMMMDASSMVADQLIGFRNSGIQVALDDFGTGYSSLSYLKRFDIDYIKIDRAFVKNLDTDADDRILCEAIVVMAHKLNLKVIAEGVETDEQKLILQNIGCDFAQGYLFSKPMDKESFEKFALKAN